MIWNSKKASGIGDIIVIFTMFFVVVVAMMTIYKPMSNVNQLIQGNDYYDANSKEIADEMTSWTPDFFDTALIILLFVFCIGMFVSSYFIDSHPIFLGAFFFLLIFVIIGIAKLSNVYVELAVGDAMAVAVLVYPKCHYVMGHLAHVVLLIGIIEAIVLFAKWRSS